MKDFINKSGLKFTDISSEGYRDYPFDNGTVLSIVNPLKLHVSKSGAHRVFSASGASYYIKPSEDWYIKWVAKQGEANFLI